MLLSEGGGRPMFSFHHVTISSRDADLSIRFYEQLGFQSVLQWSSPGNELRIVHMKLEAFLLEIFSYANWQEAPLTMRSLETDLPRLGTKHFGLKVADIEKARDYLIHIGMANNPKISEGRTGIRYFFINDPDGNWIEIVQDDRGL
ncbi:MAG: VOC family protein [Xanthobacteraceae bacterium]